MGGLDPPIHREASAGCAMDGRVKPGHGEKLYWQPDRRSQSTQLALAQHNIAAMGSCDVAGNGQAQAAAAGLQVAAFVQAGEGAEGFFMAAFGNAWSVILDGDFHQSFVALQAERDMASML